LFAIIPKMHTSSSSETELKCSARCLTDMSTSAPSVTTRQRATRTREFTLPQLRCGGGSVWLGGCADSRCPSAR
jgi:hypothetical protein